MLSNVNLRAFLNNISAMRAWPIREMGGGSFVLEIPLPTGRTQVVHVTPARDADNVEIVFFWSPAAPAGGTVDPWMLLRENVQLSYGSYAVKDGNVIVVTSRVAQFLNVDELARVLFYVGQSADELERRVVGYDAN